MTPPNDLETILGSYAPILLVLNTGFMIRELLQYNPQAVGPRKMTAIIPSLQEDGKPHVFPPASDGGPVLMDDYKCGQFRDKMVIMHNKQPHFNKQLAAYCLNFNGRVTKPSVKNFQLVADSDPDAVILQFGKIGRNLFTMDYQHPMSALQVRIINLQ